MHRTISDNNRQLAEAQNWHCAYCGVIMVDYLNSPLSATTDHIIPRQTHCASGRWVMLRGRLCYKNYVDTWENLVSACNACNNAKGSHSAWDFYQKSEIQLIPLSPLQLQRLKLTLESIRLQREPSTVPLTISDKNRQLAEAQNWHCRDDFWKYLSECA